MVGTRSLDATPPPGRALRVTWERVPWRQAEGLLQEGQLGVEEAEGLIHHVGPGLNLHLQQGDRFAPAHTESHLQ